MSAYENVHNLGREEAWKKIEEAGLRDYGYYPVPLASYKGKTIREAAAALNNCDLDHVLKQVLYADPEAVIEGLAIFGTLVGAEALVLQLPEEDADRAAQLQPMADRYDMTIELGMVDHRRHPDLTAIHYVTALNLERLFTGKFEPGVLAAVKRGDTVSALKKVPFGTSFKEIIGDTAGLKAFAFGSRLYAIDQADQKIEEDMPLSSGLLRLYSEQQCIVHETEEELLSFRRASCGKCTFCREGLFQLHTMVRDMTQGRSQAEDFALMKEIAPVMKDSVRCSLGEASPDFLLDALGAFRSEFEEHSLRKQCRTGVCRNLIHIYIDPMKCTGCGECLDVCDADAIEGRPKFIHMITEADCTRCGKCLEACPEKAVVATGGRVPKLPLRLMRVGTFRRH